MRVLNGTNAGKLYHVVSNTTTSITLQESASGFAATDIVVFELRNVVPSTRNTFIDVMEDFDFPTPTREVEEVYAHGAGQDRNLIITKKLTFESSMPVVMQNWRFAFMGFGIEKTTGTDVSGGGGGTLTTATQIGETIITGSLDAAYAVNDYIEIESGGTNPEVRKITAISGNDRTLDFPLRYAHAATVVLNEVTSPYTHTITANNEVSGFDLVGVYDEATDLVRDALFTKITTIDLASSVDDLLKCSVDIRSSDVIDTQSAPSVTVVTTDPFHYRMVSGGITLNAINYANVESFSYKLDRGIQTIYTHQDTVTNKPFYLIEGRRKHEVSMVIIPLNKNIYDLIVGGTLFTASVTFTRGSNDTFTITWANVLLSSAPHGMVIDGPVKVTATMHPGSLTSISVTDSIPYYPSG
ncbi:hypothetical protein KKF45_04705 [Patescibacteria group bacterium]|nr:hypothetical protein [Patescibacteria group bacterium]